MTFVANSVNTIIITVSASIDRHCQRFVKIWGFFDGDGLLEFIGFLPPKASKSGLLGQKSGGLFKFCWSGGLIKSGVL